jgi:hypothetical protein
MIKTLVIIVLLVLLIAGAALSRPSEESFRAFYRSQVAQQNQGLLDKVLSEARINDYLGNTKYKNRVLWADVEHEGKIAYTGAFSHWFSREKSPVAESAKK